MPLTANDVIKIAHLARLGINQQDIESYTKDLSSMLDVEPMAHPMDQMQRLRADEITEENNREKFMSIAPQVEAGFYLVPKVIE